MTSPSSGYISMGGNLSQHERPPTTVNTTVSVPDKHAVMISLKEKTKHIVDMSLFYSKSVSGRILMWNRHQDPKSDFAHLIKTEGIFLEVHRPNCINTTCFRLSFSFFPENHWPVQMSSGLWNCSVQHYTSFHQHLACNLKAECEDGRDETGPCPYSSTHCHGMIALCGRCYTIVDSLREFVKNETDMNKRANNYCNSIGAQLSLPKCVYNLVDTIRDSTKIHTKRISSILTGLYIRDVTLPMMYMQSLVHEDKTVLHHSFTLSWYSSEFKMCFMARDVAHKLNQDRCKINTPTDFNYGAFCEFQENKMEEAVHHSGVVSVHSKGFPLSTEQQSVTKCPGGHVTHTFLLCGSNQYQICSQQSRSPCVFSNHSSESQLSDSSDHHISVVPTFACNNDVTRLSYTLVCDFLADCPDESDESFCQYPPCANKFRCASGQCVLFDKVCDRQFHCQDYSDEKECYGYRRRHRTQLTSVSPPAIVNFDGTNTFISRPMNSNESCPESHFRCPGAFNDCLPVYTRCNSMYDCIDHQDEEGCAEITCSGLFQCRLSKICVHRDHICDGWSHCPMNDDEMLCNVTCPMNCLCHGHTFWCPRPFYAAHFPQLRYLDATGSGMMLSDVNNNYLLIGAVFAHCSIRVLPKPHFLNLKTLDLSHNTLQHISVTSFLGLKNIQTLSLSNNPLTSLHAGPPSVHQHSALTALDLSHTPLTVLDTTVLALFPKLQKLNLTSTTIHTISPEGFQYTPLLAELYMDKSPVQTFPADMFKTLSNLCYVSTQNYKLCCREILPSNFSSSNCIAPRDEISSCEDLLQSWTYRGFLWLVACLSLTGNVFCCCARLFAKSLASSSGFSVFVANLTIADFLMGVYITIIGAADERFRGRYLYKDDIWKHSVTCKVAGFLSLLSSEVSALIIWFITLDRFIVLRFPFSTMRFNRTSAAVACLLTWLAGWCLAVLPLLPVTSHWEFYSQTGICVPLPVTRQDFKGRVYSFGVLIVLNFIVFLFISAGQALIYWTIQNNALKTDSTKVSRDMTIARRLITIAVTDFLCWFPIGLCGLLALAGTPIPGEVNVILAIFVLPLNSAINPFLYTLNTLAEKRRKMKEVKLLHWLKSHPDLIG